MKKASMFFLALGVLLAMNSAQAADKGAKGKGDVVEGKVSTEKKDADKFTSVKIKTDKGDIINVTLDEKGIQVGKEYEAIRVYVQGKIATKGTEKWITVTQIGEGNKKKK